MTCFLRIEMHYLEPCKIRLSAWIMEFNLRSAACMIYLWILEVDVHMDLGILDKYNFVRPSLENHEDMYGMSGD